MSIIAKLFMSGRSQAIRLPARLRMPGQEVEISPMLAGFWVQAKAPASHNMGTWLQAFYEQAPALPEDFLADRQDGLPQVRDWS